MDHPEKYIILDDDEEKMMMLLMKRKFIVRECDDQDEVVDQWRDLNHGEITINHICN